MLKKIINLKLTEFRLSEFMYIQLWEETDPTYVVYVKASEIEYCKA